ERSSCTSFPAPRTCSRNRVPYTRSRALRAPGSLAISRDRRRRDRAPAEEEQKRRSHHMKHIGLALVVSIVLIAPPSFAADKEAGEEIRQHPGGLIQTEWLRGRDIKDEH